MSNISSTSFSDNLDTAIPLFRSKVINPSDSSWRNASLTGLLLAFNAFAKVASVSR
jgi:hypothetical protein